MLTKLLNCYSLYIADYPSIISDVLKEKPISTTLLPIITIIFIYYIYTYVRKFYPITVNCWFCNSNFSVPYENKSEFTCSQCGQFNGFKDDGSYSKEILEQHDEILNNDHFVVSQNNTKENKNGLCNRCNIIQEIKIKQLASFTPSKEKYFDKEIDAFKNNLEKTLKLCHKCDLYTKKILFIQQQRYSLKQISNRFQTLTYNSLKWPLISSICLSILNVLFIFHIENDLGTQFFEYLSLNFLNNNIITTDQLIIITCIFGSTLLIYQNFMELEILNLITMFCWFLLTIVNIFHIFEDYAIKLLLITFDILIPTYTLMISFATKRNDSTNIKIIDQNCSSSPFDTSENESLKNCDTSEMMEVDYDTPTKKGLENKQVNNLFRSMKLNDYNSQKSFIKPPKLFASNNRNKLSEYTFPSSGFYPTYSTKSDYEFDTRSLYSQHSCHSICSPYYHQAVTPYHYYPSPQQSPLNLSQSSNISNVQYGSEWLKMIMYSIPGVILLILHCYLLYDLKDLIKQK